MATGIFAFTVAPHQAGVRLDRFLGEHLPGCSRTQAGRLAHGGQVQVNGRCAKPSVLVRAGDLILASVPPPAPLRLAPEPMTLEVLFEDRHMIVVNKPPGLVVHPAPGHAKGTLVNGLLHHCPDLQPIGGEIRPGIVHRLDKDTSGVLVAAKHREALEGLALQFARREVRKVYLALVRGVPDRASGRMDWPIGRHPVDRKKMSIHARRSRTAVTNWQIRRRFDGSCLLEVDLETGRTHQIRVHCAALGHPVLGDAVYGHPSRDRQSAGFQAGRQMLHAWRLQLNHPVSAAPMAFEAPLPPDMASLLDRLAAARDRSAPFSSQR